MADFKDANAAYKNWQHVNTRLKSIGSNAGGETDNDNAAVGKKRGKREAADMPAAPPAKRGRKRKNAPPPAEEAEAEEEEQKLAVKDEAGEL